jgi:hypothetical protein
MIQVGIGAGIGGGGTGAVSDFIYFDAAALMAANTDGATFAQDESTTYGINEQAFMFPGDANKYVQLRLPQVDGLITSATFNARLILKRYTAADANYDVEFKVSASIIRNNPDVQDFGTAGTINETLTTEGGTYVTDWTTGIVASGALTDMTYLILQIYRNVAGTDTLDGYCGLLGVEIEINQ